MDSRNRVALSGEVLRRLDLRPGDYIAFEVDLMGCVRLHKLSICKASPPAPSTG